MSAAVLLISFLLISFGHCHGLADGFIWDSLLRPPAKTAASSARSMSASKHMWDEYVLGDVRHEANTVRAVELQSAIAYERENVVELAFNLSALPDDERLLEAQLRVHICRTNVTLRTNVHEILNSSAGITRLLDTGTDDGRASTSKSNCWRTFDVTPAALRNGRTRAHVQLLVKLVSAQSSLNAAIHDRLNQLLIAPMRRLEQRASLVIYGYDSSTQTRRKTRRTPERPQSPSRRRPTWRRMGRRKDRRVIGEKTDGMCQRREVYVDFRELNWQDWILAPSGFSAYFCAGSCRYPLASSANASNHAIVQSLVNSVSPAATPEPCCVPTRMAAISMLYIDANQHILIKNYPDMVVAACGCR